MSVFEPEHDIASTSARRRLSEKHPLPRWDEFARSPVGIGESAVPQLPFPSSVEEEVVEYDDLLQPFASIGSCIKNVIFLGSGLIQQAELKYFVERIGWKQEEFLL